MRSRIWIVVGAALIGGTVALLVALSMDGVSAYCDGRNGFRCDFKPILGWQVKPFTFNAILMGIGASAGGILGLALARSTRRSVHT
jgi:hypothetical protein